MRHIPPDRVESEAEAARDERVYAMSPRNSEATNKPKWDGRPNPPRDYSQSESDSFVVGFDE